MSKHCHRCTGKRRRNGPAAIGGTRGHCYSSRRPLSTSIRRALGFGRRADVAGGAAIAASTFGQVPSALQRLYQRQHVDVDA